MSEQGPFSANAALVLGESHGPMRVDTAGETADAALALARQARYVLRIFSRDLDRRLY
ncbi:MAG: hypothetical protein U5K43_06945 [Halofilum sp. (in: g-proteobacteria)]|nr:hypothetical protein [Halofilum sp. (in: g-proteobacteria)]